MTSYEENRAALMREREARQVIYSAAAAARAALPADADHASIRKAEARVELAHTAMREWGDPLPKANSNSAGREGTGSLSPRSSPAETVQESRYEVSETDEVEAIARRIAAA